MTTLPKIATCLWFDGNAEEAARFYTSLVPGSSVGGVLRPDPRRPPVMGEFTLAAMRFQALNGGPMHTLTEAVSISLTTPDQEETDRLWDALTADGGSGRRCAWLKDRFGLSWQIVPEVLPRLLSSPDREAAGRAMQAMLGMGKIDIAGLQAAYDGVPGSP